jgi:hypothetical protein
MCILEFAQSAVKNQANVQGRHFLMFHFPELCAKIPYQDSSQIIGTFNQNMFHIFIGTTKVACSKLLKSRDISPVDPALVGIV